MSFAPGYPDPTRFRGTRLRDISSALLESHDGNTLQYGPTRGLKPLLEQALGVLEAVASTTLEHLIVTSGSQQGIDLIARVLVSPAMSSSSSCRPSPAGSRPSRTRRPNWSACGRTPTASILEDLDAVWQREHRAGKRVKLLYVIPNFQNPTGSLLALDRRARLLEWAERRDLLIVEDDPYGSLYFEDVATRGRDAADPRRRCEWPGALSEHRIEDAGARLSRRLDGGAAGADRAVRYRQAIDRPHVRHPRSAHRDRGASRESSIDWLRGCASFTGTKRDVMERRFASTSAAG